MKQIKLAKTVDVLVNIHYIIEDNCLIQCFSYTVSNKRYLDYLFDKRFLFKNKIEKIIDEFILENGFIKRTDEKSETRIYYEMQEKPKPVIRKVSAYMPPNFGCEYCSKAQKEGDFIFCPEKNKHYHKSDGIGRCPVFTCKEEIIT